MEFNETLHRYTYNGKVLQSVSSWIAQFTPDFPAELIAEKCAKKENCTPRHILNKWKLKGNIALHQGNWVHDSIQYYLKYDSKFTNEPVEAFKKLQNDNTYHSEIIVHDDELAGTIDLIEVIEKGKVKLHDFKTNGDLYKKNGKLQGQFKHLDNTPINKYTLQLSKYKELLEKMKGVEVLELNLWHYVRGEFEIINIKPIEL